MWDKALLHVGATRISRDGEVFFMGAQGTEGCHLYRNKTEASCVWLASLFLPDQVSGNSHQRLS